MRRVVVTGIGLVTPLASGVDDSWNRLLAAGSGAGPIQKFDASDLACRIACEVPRGEGAGLFNADVYLAPKDQRKVDLFIIFGMAAAQQAIEDSGWAPTDEAAVTPPPDICESSSIWFVLITLIHSAPSSS